eukprot:scaffold11933_cov117-Skeletonema_dohrnii-CCMP3373.AAC.7
MNDNKSSPTKKRKSNDGRASTDGAYDVNTGNTNDGGGYFSGQRAGASSGPSHEVNNTSQLDRMEQIMMRMEEKLATVESRCERLEAKCSSLENMLESTSNKIDCSHLHLEQKCNSLENKLETKVDTIQVTLERSLKRHEYNEMLVKNQSWEYSAAVYSEDELIDNGYTYDVASYLAETAEELNDITTKMRRGEFPSVNNNGDDGKGIYIEMYDSGPPLGYALNNKLLPHWQEFAAALKHFAPAINVLPDNCESFVELYFVQLNHEAMLLIKEALIGKPFQKLTFTNNDNGDDDFPAGMSVDAIIDIVESNTHLQKLEIRRNQIGRDHIERLCPAVYTHPALVELDVFNCFEPGIGDTMLASLLTSDDLKLEKFVISDNYITSGVSTELADFLATNPRLKILSLGGNNLTDSDAALIANALRSNTTLRTLLLYGNNITKVGKESLRLVLYDESSLNVTADSNHTCTVDLLWHDIDGYNSHEQGHINRGRKIYSILSTRNEMMSNVQHFSDIDVKILPKMLEAVQKYATNVHDYKVNPLSIVYEVMRKWDKALTCTGAGSIIET